MDIKPAAGLIQRALQKEQQHGLLLAKLEAQLPSLSTAIALPEGQPAKAQRDFGAECMKPVPGFIATLSYAARGAEIDDCVQAFLEIAQDHLTSPEGLDQDEVVVFKLLEQAYLAQRLIEEVHDQYTLRVGIHLISMDATKANIMVNHLLGEAPTNSLDEVVK